MLVGSIALPADPPATPPNLKSETFRGKVINLADVLKKHALQPDPDAAPFMLALDRGDGRPLLLLKDAGSRLFFNDPQLLNRPMEIQGRLIPNTPFLQVLQTHSLKNDRLHQLYYWCEVCAIKRYVREKTGICECCGGPMELREIPVDAKR